MRTYLIRSDRLITFGAAEEDAVVEEAPEGRRFIMIDLLLTSGLVGDLPNAFYSSVTRCMTYEGGSIFAPTLVS